MNRTKIDYILHNRNSKQLYQETSLIENKMPVYLQECMALSPHVYVIYWSQLWKKSYKILHTSNSNNRDNIYRVQQRVLYSAPQVTCHICFILIMGYDWWLWYSRSATGASVLLWWSDEGLHSRNISILNHDLELSHVC
jgi:hypothetical protein